jgi:hypothetical protein
MKSAGLLAALPMCNELSALNAAPAPVAKEIYEWRLFNLKTEGNELDAFYADTLIPAYNRQKVKVGAFAPLQASEAPQRYFLFVYPNIMTYYKVKTTIWKDAIFRKDAQPFYDASASTPIYAEFSSFLCEAFDKIPKLIMPDKSRTILEWRNYKSPNEEANQRKIKMFNSGEIETFHKTGINSVCYGEVFAGPRMPSLIYLTWHKDQATRDQAWKDFGSHPEWQHMRSLPEYANTATDNKVVLLSPLAYSQI